MANEFNNQPDYSAQGAEVQSAVTQALNEQKKKKRKKRLIILGVLAVLIIGVIALASGGNEDNKVETISPSATVEDAAETEDTTQAEKENKVKVGQAITLDTMKISFVSADTDYKKFSAYSKPKSGNKVIRAAIKFENTSSSDISLSGFECYADNKKCEEFYSPDDYASPTLESVSPGRSFNAVVYFEVPSKAKSVELEIEDSFFSSDKIIFVVE